MTAGTQTRLIVALDVPSFEQASSLIERLAPLDVMFKVGHEALYGYGEALFARLEALQRDYFVDAKLHDIPRTVGAGVRALARPGARIINVHALGGFDMMVEAVAAARIAARERGFPPAAIFAVTMLTSIDDDAMHELGIAGTVEEEALRLALLAKLAGASGVVCSAAEAPVMKATLGADFLTICPGIRPAGTAAADQKRVTTPAQAVSAGADYIVVGRPIVEANDPPAAARDVLAEMERA